VNARSCAPLTMQRPAGTGSWLKSWVGLLARVGKGERVGERNARWAGSADTKEYGVWMIRLMILRIRCAAADQTSRKTWQHKPDEIYCTVDVHKIKGAPRKGEHGLGRTGKGRSSLSKFGATIGKGFRRSDLQQSQETP
jgi:hypothetical protein